MNLMVLSRIFLDLSYYISVNNENRTVYYSSRALKYMHPSLFHCYYAGKETWLTFLSYLDLNSAKDISYNMMYKTG
jgi:hypothetical protein